MKAKAITRIILFAVVLAAVGAWAVKEFGGSAAAAAKAGDGQPAAAVVRPDGITIINFHGTTRCRTCIRIGDLARKALDEEFAAEEKAGKLHWEHVNYDEPAHNHCVKDYELVSSTVVASVWRDGKELKWVSLDGVWDHVGDEPAFRAYIAENVRNLLAEMP